MAEMAFEPAFPGEEVERLRDERMNDLLQAWSDPRRRAERVFPETVFAPSTPYSRPLAGIQTTVRPLDRTPSPHATRRRRPRPATLVVAGDLAGLPLRAGRGALGGWPSPWLLHRPARRIPAAKPAGARIVLVDRPARRSRSCASATSASRARTLTSTQISVLNAILGGTFNSRLNRVIREEKGYSYGDPFVVRHAPAAGPFAVRCAVETAVTLPALEEILRIVREHARSPRSTPEELNVARDYLVGVFPLRFENPGRSPPRSPGWSSSICPTTSSIVPAGRRGRRRQRTCSRPRCAQHPAR